ncbi:DUF3888 domain-containing protein [Neobacillus terrae]|uniref:DUF3888 domain-containing protein n=1 Tax=Neobacillus terrae TaxID=3034837 RepID=UPI00140C9B4C|nr:DUF3888 domain-containing protein [Neobacillus terrae]NHM34074.1 DUF3888 domain-containing protein [Neobacillus terrae]
MRKKFIFFIILIFMLLLTPDYSKATNIPQEKELIQLLQAPILSVVGTDWFRGKEKVLEIKKDREHKGVFYVKVQVVTFQGPHNPPYTEEIITFKIKGNKVKPIDYYNRVIPESEWIKFKIK